MPAKDLPIYAALVHTVAWICRIKPCEIEGCSSRGFGLLCQTSSYVTRRVTTASLGLTGSLLEQLPTPGLAVSSGSGQLHRNAALD